MSRIGQSPIAVPSGVEITLDESRLIVKGSKGSLEQSIPESITITQEGDTVLVARIDDERETFPARVDALISGQYGARGN
jgi:large subunit ribosomal protein L6